MKKRFVCFCIAVAFLSLAATPVTAQGYPVLDVANLMQAINTLYAAYDQITATIEQVQNTYRQLQKQIEMVQHMGDTSISAFSIHCLPGVARIPAAHTQHPPLPVPRGIYPVLSLTTMNLTDIPHEFF
jgi:hypothetical protein